MLLYMIQKIRKITSKKDRNNYTNGIIHINSTFNNTIVTITNLTGNTISWASAGSSGFKGARKGTPFAAQTAAEKAAAEALNIGLKTVEILVKGQSPDRKSTRLNFQSHHDLVCRLLLEKKNNICKYFTPATSLPLIPYYILHYTPSPHTQHLLFTCLILLMHHDAKSDDRCTITR